MPTPQTPNPRVIIEQQPDGTLVIESYVNGARSRTPIIDGFVEFEIRQALCQQAAAIAATARRKAEAEAEAAQQRHARVWSVTAQRHGVGFANRTVNGISSLKQHARVDEKPKPARNTAKDLIALL